MKEMLQYSCWCYDTPPWLLQCFRLHFWQVCCRRAGKYGSLICFCGSIWTLASIGTAVPPPLQALQTILPVPPQVPHPASFMPLSDHRLQKHSTTPVPRHLGHARCPSLLFCTAATTWELKRALVKQSTCKKLTTNLSFEIPPNTNPEQSSRNDVSDCLKVARWSDV